jgi:hypothetical protein
LFKKHSFQSWLSIFKDRVKFLLEKSHSMHWKYTESVKFPPLTINGVRMLTFGFTWEQEGKVGIVVEVVEVVGGDVVETW